MIAILSACKKDDEFSEQSEIIATIPSVTTLEINSITALSACGGGIVTDDGGAEVTSRGICWSLDSLPTINNYFTIDSCGLGEFTSNLTDLEKGSTYYVRAYASNSKGIAYGEQKSFTTIDTDNIPSITTTEITNISITTAVSGGNIITSNGANITARGVCWSINTRPTLNDFFTIDGSGEGIFTSNITGLSEETTYHVRAYATSNIGTVYGEERSFTSLKFPDISTADVTDIKLTSAVCGGNVSCDSMVKIIVKGVCWDKNPNPTIYDTHSENGNNIGDFTSNITDLEEGTTYYVRAYVTTNEGTIYGEERSFRTLEFPSVETIEINDITISSAICKGFVFSDGGYEVTVRGFCWNTTGDPSLSDSHSEETGGTGSFTSQLYNLSENTTYYVKAYATNAAGTKYGKQIEFTSDITACYKEYPFSIDPNKSIVFSPGNLQYQASTNTWRFAKHQYEYVGIDNSNISPEYDGWIDLFGWGTSGWDCGNKYYKPTSYSADGSSDAFLYGPPGEYDLTGDYANSDWGVYNVIENYPAGTWRTPTIAELIYIIESRPNANNLCSQGTVNNVHGLILLPDNWILPSGLSFIGMANNYSSNVYSAYEWTLMEANGAVFLPSASFRLGNNTNPVFDIGHYRSSTLQMRGYSRQLIFDQEKIYTVSFSYCYYGFSVRLVK